jgi:adenylate cyclase
MLVWTGDKVPAPTAESATPSPPSSYTPSHLAERIRAEHAAMESRGSADGERKTITALFADLKVSTALIEGLDPEDVRALLDELT